MHFLYISFNYSSSFENSFHRSRDLRFESFNILKICGLFLVIVLLTSLALKSCEIFVECKNVWENNNQVVSNHEESWDEGKVFCICKRFLCMSTCAAAFQKNAIRKFDLMSFNMTRSVLWITDRLLEVTVIQRLSLMEVLLYYNYETKNDVSDNMDFSSQTSFWSLSVRLYLYFLIFCLSLYIIQMQLVFMR